MEIRNLYKPFDIELMETDHYAARMHQNTFFEMVFTLEGTGIQSINDQELPYSPDKLFLIFPRDKHGFEVHTFSRFIFIRFHETYLKTQSRGEIRKLEFIFNNHNHLPGCILKNTEDKPLIRAMAEALIREENGQNPHRREVTEQLINTLIAVAARNITLIMASSPGAKGNDLLAENSSSGSLTGKNLENVSRDLLNYIHLNIYQPENLRVGKIAAHINRSPAYTGEYFKKQTGETLQQYIISYKLKLVEARLQFTNLRLSEIAAEFGFTDESHLNRLFRKNYGLNPGQYRKKQRLKEN